MVNKILLLCVVVVFLTANFIECRRFSSGFGSSRRSSRGNSYRTSSNHQNGARTHYSSSSSSGFGSNSHNYPHSGGLSGAGGSSTGSGRNKYPPSGGLSGSGATSSVSGNSKYPASLSGLSGYSGSSPGSGSSIYPPSHGLSGSGATSSTSGNGKYPASLSGLSGYSGISSRSGSSNYPPSGGLSGSGATTSVSGNSKYPASSSGLSGYSGSSPGSGSSNYPPSRGLSGSGATSSTSGNSKYTASLSGLSGYSGTSSGSGNSNYPPSNGLSGSGSISSPTGAKYPLSSSGLSGSGAAVTRLDPKQPTGYSGVGVQSYPSPTVTSVSGYQYLYNQPSVNNNYGSYRHGSGSLGYEKTLNYPSTYYNTSPQYIYVTENRNSGGRFSNILTGLALYDLARSLNRDHHHNYIDDYSRQRHEPLGKSYNTHRSVKPESDANCTLRIKQNEKLEILKIPCDIVSTFTEGSSDKPVITNQNNTRPCVTSIVNTSLPASINISSVNSTRSFNVAGANTTNCISDKTTANPLILKGLAVNSTHMECAVEIITKSSRVLNKVDCSKLIEYSKTNKPIKEMVTTTTTTYRPHSKSTPESWWAKFRRWFSI